MLAVETIDLFYGAAQALRGVSLKAEPGRVTCVLGRNGVGKTSLLRAIVGQQPIRAGRILWRDADISRLATHARARAGIGFVPQGREIFPLLTVRENLMTGFAPLARKLHSIPDEVFELFPVLKTMLGRRGGDLSGGQQQQLAIGRALTTRPRLLVLDEPTAGVDPQGSAEIRDLIVGFKERGITVLLCSHLLGQVQALRPGRVLDRGGVAALGRLARLGRGRPRVRVVDRLGLLVGRSRA